MPGRVPGVHVYNVAEAKDVDGRNKSGHDDGKISMELSAGAEQRVSGAL